VYGKHLGGYAAVVDVNIIEGVVVGRGSDGGCDAEGGAEGEFGFACEVEAEDAALVSLGGEFHCVVGRFDWGMAVVRLKVVRAMSSGKVRS
jgi:hypothetical protein